MRGLRTVFLLVHDLLNKTSGENTSAQHRFQLRQKLDPNETMKEMLGTPLGGSWERASESQGSKQSGIPWEASAS